MKPLSRLKTAGCLLVMVLSGIAHAQKNEHFGLSFTPRAAVNFSYAGLDDQETKSFKISPEGGIEVKLDLSKHLGITAGVYYTQRAKYYVYYKTQSFFTDLSNSFFGSIPGADTLIESFLGVTSDYVNDTIYSTYRGKVNIQYLQVPVMASLDLGDFSISAGAYIAFKLKARSLETLTQNFPLLKTFEPALSDSAIAPYIGLFTSQYTALNEPQISGSGILSWVNNMDFGLMGQLSARFSQRFQMATMVSYGLKNYSNNSGLYPGKHFSVSMSLGFTLGKIKGTALPTRFF